MGTVGKVNRVVASLTVTLLFMFGTAGAAAAVSPLTGETLQWNGRPGNGDIGCSPLGSTTTLISYDLAFGVATGPYAGSFDESGDIHVANGVVTQWHATFTITDATGGVVNGQKDLVTGGPATCSATPTFPSVVSGSASADLSYSATLPGGAIDQGPVHSTMVVNQAGSDPTGSSLTEDFGPTSPSQLVANLLSQVKAQQLGPGMSLDSKLQAVAASIDRGNMKAACNQLRAFENEVSAQTGKSLPPDQGLTNSAQQIEAALGC